METEAYTKVLSTAVDVLNMSTNPRMRKVSIVLSTANVIAGIATDIYQQVSLSRRWSATLPGQDRLGPALVKWVHANANTTKPSPINNNPWKTFFNHDAGNSFRAMVIETNEQKVGSLDTRYVLSEALTFTYRGHTYRVEVVPDEPTGVERLLRARRTGPQSLTIQGVGENSLNVFTSLLKELVKVKEEPQLLGYSGWDGWCVRSTLPLRRLDTVCLTGTLKTDLVEDLSTFFDSADQYIHLGLPWHRGYMFHGPPGTGKTSLALALAERFKRNLYHLPMSEIDNDARLTEAFSNVHPESLVLLEDVDVLSITRERQDNDIEKKGGPTLAGLMNILDGVATPHGLVTIMTTNHLHRIEPALIRPGRVDKIVELGYATTDQVRDILATFCPKADPLPATFAVREKTTPAEIIEVLKTRLQSPETVTPAILVNFAHPEHKHEHVAHRHPAP